MSFIANDEIESLHQRLTSQLDCLVAFLALAHEEVFEVVQSEYDAWYLDQRRETLPENFDIYAQQIVHSAFLLGYSYVEAFVSDMLITIYSARPELLKPDAKLEYREVTTRSDLESVLEHMIDKTVDGFNSLQNKLEVLNGLGIRPPQSDTIEEAHHARNAIVHNAGRINRPLPEGLRWERDQTVTLTPDDVHEFGLLVRDFADDLAERAKGLCAA